MKRKSIEEVIENPQEDEFYVLVTREYPRKLRFEGLSLGEKENPIDYPTDKMDFDLAPSKELIRDWQRIHFRSGLPP